MSLVGKRIMIGNRYAEESYYDRYIGLEGIPIMESFSQKDRKYYLVRFENEGSIYIREEDCIPVEMTTNKQASSLLSKEELS